VYISHLVHRLPFNSSQSGTAAVAGGSTFIMSPSALADLDQAAQTPNGVHLTNGNHPAPPPTNGHASSKGFKQTEFLLDRNLHKSFPIVMGGSGNYLYLEDGRTVFDATSGAAVSCVGHGHKRVIKAISALMDTGMPYLATTFWACEIVEELCKELIKGTNGKMARIYLTGSGQYATKFHLRLLMSGVRL
jgi:4-aminobutyrate aminotransferase-like enzyme